MFSEIPALYPPWHMATQLPPLATILSPRHGSCPLQSSQHLLTIHLALTWVSPQATPVTKQVRNGVCSMCTPPLCEAPWAH